MTDKTIPKKPTNVKSIRPEIKVEIEEEVKQADPVVIGVLDKLREQVDACNLTELVLLGVGDDGQVFRSIVGSSKNPFLLASIITTAQDQYNEERVFPFTAPELYEFIEDID
jgi:hypothetical protein